MCLPQLVDCLTSLNSDPLKRHRAAQAASALAKIHHLKKKRIVPHSLALQQIVEFARRARHQVKVQSKKTNLDPSDSTVLPNGTELKTNVETETEVWLYFLFNIQLSRSSFQFLAFSHVL